MAELLRSVAEQDHIREILEELGDEIDDFFADARVALTCDEWAVLVEYATASVRRVLEVGASLHAVADAHETTSRGYAGRGRTTFVRAGLGAWRDSYAPMRDVWRVAILFPRIPGGERRVRDDIETLETMAANRLFTSLDEEGARLFSAGA